MSKLPPRNKVTRSAIIKGDLLGLPGQPLRFVMRRVIPKEEGLSKPAKKPGADVTPFSVTFTLSRPGEAISPDKRVSSSALLTGNSYLRLRPSDASPTSETSIRFPVLTEEGLFEIQESVNTEGFISKLEILSIKAKDFSQAENIARKLIMPSISWHSTHLDIPLHIYQVDVVNLTTEDFMIYRAAKPFDALVIPKGIRIYDVKKESAAYASVYREALNSNSHIYQFLCFYKIIDGIRKRRKRLSRKAITVGQSSARSSERVPEDINALLNLLRKTFMVNFAWDEIEAETVLPKEFWGREITDIVDHQLKPLRNELAHAFLRSGEIPLSVDELANAAKVTKYLTMTKCFARWMLRNEFPDQFLSRS